MATKYWHQPHLMPKWVNPALTQSSCDERDLKFESTSALPELGFGRILRAPSNIYTSPSILSASGRERNGSSSALAGFAGYDQCCLPVLSRRHFSSGWLSFPAASVYCQRVLPLITAAEGCQQVSAAISARYLCMSGVKECSILGCELCCVDSTVSSRIISGGNHNMDS